MPNDALVEHILSAAARSSPTGRAVLKSAVAMVKQIDQEYDIQEETDQRIRLTKEGMDLVPDQFEVWSGVVRPKH